MSVCSDPTRVCPINWCATSTLVGTISSAETAIYVFIKNLSTGRLQRQETTTTATGRFGLDLSDPDAQFYNSDSDFELWVTLESANNQNDARETITLMDTTTSNTCFILTFEGIKDANGDNITSTVQTLSV